AWPGQRGREPLRGNVLVHVAGLELDHMDVSRLPDALQVSGGQHSPFTQVGSKVVDEHAANHFLLLRPAA
ncbi:MAG TPA: hypothetical protein VIP57_14970, partial [Candidatus Dormibacteraeota bacterium]